MSVEGSFSRYHPTVTGEGSESYSIARKRLVWTQYPGGLVHHFHRADLVQATSLFFKPTAMPDLKSEGLQPNEPVAMDPVVAENLLCLNRLWRQVS
jgi:hypothetical protein